MSPTHWRTKLQKTVMLSTAEAAASTAVVEITYLDYPCLLLKDMGFFQMDACQSTSTATCASSGVTPSSVAENELSTLTF